jgi:hypothetical protein
MMEKVAELLEDDSFAKFGKNINVTEGKRFLKGHEVSMTNTYVQVGDFFVQVGDLFVQVGDLFVRLVPILSTLW